MLLIQRPSLETNWLRATDKDICQPPVCVLDAECEYGGFYVRPQRGEYLLEGRHVELDKGLIVLSRSASPGVLAHEWRHHWQCYNGWEYDGLSWRTLLSGYGYWGAVYTYFTESHSELDALNYELSMYPSETSMQWHEHLVVHRTARAS